MGRIEKHTPGPWRVREATERGIFYQSYVIGPPIDWPSDGEQIACRTPTGLGGRYLANARLIAAAPDMLEALDEADTAFAAFNVCGDCPQTRGAIREAWAKVSAAYAKATGRPDRFAEANKEGGAE
jgi:hypothetical protein